MGLLNYTTSIDVHRTLGEIQGALVSHGANRILVENDKYRQPGAVTFALTTAAGEQSFRLRTNIGAILRVLSRQKERGEIRVVVDRERAARVGWRILLTWLVAQLAIIETEMVTFDEVMLPYMLVGDGGTVYDMLTNGRLPLLLRAPGEVAR